MKITRATEKKLIKEISLIKKQIRKHKKEETALLTRHCPYLKRIYNLYWDCRNSEIAMNIFMSSTKGLIHDIRNGRNGKEDLRVKKLEETK